jgi:hypothetical protein
MNYVTLPESEYIDMKNQLDMLKNNELISKLNHLVDLMYESKYGMYLGNSSEDITKSSIDNMQEWQESGDAWNDL